MYIHKSLKKYLEDLAAKKPTPGGGSAAALVGALGAALLSMVANFTVGKASHKARLVSAKLLGGLPKGLANLCGERRSFWRKKYKQFEGEIKKALAQTEKIRKKLLELVDLDVITYKKVVANKNKSHALYQKSLKEATLVPLKIAEVSLQALKLCPMLEKKANKYLISDVYVAKELLSATVKSAVLNVKINLPFIKDKKFVEKINGELKSYAKA